MKPFDDSELTDEELGEVLRQWGAPAAPARLRAALFPETRAPWWRRSIRVPVPVAACLAVLLAAGAWRLLTSPRPAPPARPEVQTLTFRNFQPVSEFRPRIIRRGHVQN